MPTAPVTPDLGGGRNLAHRIIARRAEIPHTTYVEPRGGMGRILFHRTFKAWTAVINNISEDLANLFRILRRHDVQRMEMLRWQPTNRAEFERPASSSLSGFD